MFFRVGYSFFEIFKDIRSILTSCWNARLSITDPCSLVLLWTPCISLGYQTVLFLENTTYFLHFVNVSCVDDSFLKTSWAIFDLYFLQKNLLLKWRVRWCIMVFPFSDPTHKLSAPDRPFVFSCIFRRFWVWISPFSKFSKYRTFWNRIPYWALGNLLIGPRNHIGPAQHPYIYMIPSFSYFLNFVSRQITSLRRFTSYKLKRWK